ncbi:bifunctional folylpolyglutamate synthase/dihydrofolate synthase [Agromyces aerolatus]|uniref:bifunctional folylpolyglutamate synthase/dihydrofolate synthase n=1 Tax=Agromyces sp. LY-1074 TaxID=3074080 RepID=UPI0028558F49|nr:MULTISPECIES: folylpolyglutamate synthase/dihydrofolate synthase family protein [unclassified Agromyces]MDR5700694.1 folylpolyglutamate synthase/dihydrofolate synthase family protein [Agromyces sp. LY-1074]MDR5707215.1 folylpolyglutamate synthase/dihydrofolate synthase family protein [Agromyces sp. LY-1358]
MTDQLPDESGASDRDAADAVYRALLERVGEQAPEPRLSATLRAVEVLGDPHRAAPVIHLTGTNGKTSTARIIESLLRANGLRTGLMTSPHLERFTERIVVDGEPAGDADVARIWSEISPYLELVDAELTREGQPVLTYFEALTVLAFAVFADAPVDVVVLEVGMGGEWDSTNVADGQVAVFTPIALDHVARLGSTVTEIARTKAGIVKPGAAVVTAFQPAEVLTVLSEVAERNDATLAVEGGGFAVLGSQVAVGGQVVSVRGLAGEYRDLELPLFGRHQAENAALAIAAVESFLGGGTVRLADEVVQAGLAQVTSPGRLQRIAADPTVIVDAAHNPNGAESLVAALEEYFDFSDLVIVLGVLADKDAEGIVRQLAPTGAGFIVTQSESERAVPADRLGAVVAGIVGAERVQVVERYEDALEDARDWAAEAPGRGVVVTGSITLVGDALAFAHDREWGHA